MKHEKRERNPDRQAAKAYANAHGYFWLPCPRCRFEFGGHEPHGALVECLRSQPVPGLGLRSVAHITCSLCVKGTEEQEAEACQRVHVRENESR